jgi:hypothetical protein
MLFDLRGSGRRRVVKIVYITLAFLMGGGLVFFGIGGDVQGGLFDAFSGDGRGGGGDDLVEKRIERNENALKRNPRNEAALKALVRDNYQLATQQTESSSVGFPKEAKDELRTAGTYWQRYVKAEEGEPDPSLATVALQIYDVTALNRPKQAQEAAAIIAEAENSSAAYIRVVQYATLAGDTRTANLAGQKAIDLAPKGQEKAVRDTVKQAKQTQAPPVQAQGN